MNLSQLHLVENRLETVKLPNFVRVHQIFDDTRVADIPAAIHQQLLARQLTKRILPGHRIAITAGSRQIANMPTILRAIAEEVKLRGAFPFLIPAMGSHGGATAAGQADLLAHYGITPETVGCPIRSNMEVQEIGRTGDGIPVYTSSTLCEEADGIILCNRIKAHPGLAGSIQSGLIKMSVIGCGKQTGAATCHRLGNAGMEARLREMSSIVLAKMPVLFGVGILENAYDQTAEIHCIPAEAIHDEEPALLQRSFSYLPRLFPNNLDVLFVDWIGKNISGVGADPAVTLRFLEPAKIAQRTRKPPTVFVMGDLTEESVGSASGVGQADIVTQRLYEKIDFGKTYVNALTSTFLPNSRLPIVMRNDSYALKLAVRTCNAPDMAQPRIVRIQNTLQLSEIYVSEALIQEVQAHPQMEILSEPSPLQFDHQGNLLQFTKTLERTGN